MDYTTPKEEVKRVAEELGLPPESTWADINRCISKRKIQGVAEELGLPPESSIGTLTYYISELERIAKELGVPKGLSRQDMNNYTGTSKLIERAVQLGLQKDSTLGQIVSAQIVAEEAWMLSGGAAYDPIRGQGGSQAATGQVNAQATSKGPQPG